MACSSFVSASLCLREAHAAGFLVSRVLVSPKAVAFFGAGDFMVF